MFLYEPNYICPMCQEWYHAAEYEPERWWVERVGGEYADDLLTVTPAKSDEASPVPLCPRCGVTLSDFLIDL